LAGWRIYSARQATLQVQEILAKTPTLELFTAEVRELSAGLPIAGVEPSEYIQAVAVIGTIRAITSRFCR
jgi:hypothetical protein